jgi:hypothetical protein
MSDDISKLFDSMKGISGSGNVLSEVIKNAGGSIRTLEPGDIVRNDPPLAIAAPIAADLWYLHCHVNAMARYYDGIDGDHYDYQSYLNANLSFLSKLPGLKPLKVFRDLKQQLSGNTYFSVDSMTMRTEWANNGIYWINLMPYELCAAKISEQVPSKKPSGDYVGYLTFPIGQLGVMEVISLIQETDLSGYQFSSVDALSEYWTKGPLNLWDIEDQDKPALQGSPEMFPDMKDGNGNQLAGKNYCFGRHLIDDAYRRPDVPVPSQNNYNSLNGTAYAPVANVDVELFSLPVLYPVSVEPKLWMRYWIHRDSTLPVPGEFIGILCRPVSCPPHVWWFQESSPFVYAGNWVETGNLTSGVVTAVTLAANRTDGGLGNLYTVKIQGCEVLVDSSDFLVYSVGDRVAVLVSPISTSSANKSFTWADRTPIKSTDALTKKSNQVIVPMTFYKVKH